VSEWRDFEEWFKKQHGPRVRWKPQTSDHDLAEMVELGQMADRELRDRQDWDHRNSSARYAWNIKDEQKP
jgi:hypothetical protein